MVYQDPLASLNPCLTVGEQLAEVLTIHQGLGGQAGRLSHDARAGPHARSARHHAPLSPPDLRRTAAARGHRHGLLANPDLLIMDEPTTGLDVTVEATVLDLVTELRRELDAAILYISHNLGVIARVCDRVGVMYAGELMEEADVTALFLAPRHPYTRSLLRCVPRADADRAAQRLEAIPGPCPGRTLGRRARLRAPVRLRPRRVSRRTAASVLWSTRVTSCAASAGRTSGSPSRGSPRRRRRSRRRRRRSSGSTACGSTITRRRDW